MSPAPTRTLTHPGKRKPLAIAALLALALRCAAGGAEPPPQPEPPPSLAAEGWYAGDLHVHRAPADMPALMRAADLHVASVITWWNETNPWRETVPQDPAVIPVDGMRWFHVLAGEDERRGGALLFHRLQRPLDITGSRPEYPSPVRFLRAARAAGAWIEIEKPFWWDTPIWLATGEIDSIGLAHNHLQIGGMLDGEAWGRPRDRERYPGPRGNGFYTQDLYYRILNSGFRAPPTAGGASGVLPNPVGYNRVYVHMTGKPSWEDWWEGLRAGRVFVSNGPLLRVQADGQVPGHVFRTGDKEVEITLSGMWDSREPLESLELVRDGVPEPLTLPGRFKVSRSGWFLVRAIAGVAHTFRFASTGAWYVEVEGSPMSPRSEDTRFFLEWTRERRKQIEEADLTEADRQEVLQPIETAEQFWEKR
ncbi:MAG TPA: CehA/McbA family metallohydrolase [Verrucomicrobiales bacterium]|nr:CehA/McbA family metallohydrolase [Verrucomicrobiales bacterium]